MTKNTTQHFLLLALGLFCVSSTQAQQSANASGGDAIGAGGSVAYSIGQVAYTSHSSSSGNIAQGVQHAFEIYALGITATTLNISLRVYPNPTEENITLEVMDYNNEKLSYQILDLQGKLISNEQIVGQQTQIGMKLLSSATYFVNIVNQENKKIQSFKIIKN